MTELAFLSPDRAEPQARFASPLARALKGADGVRDLSRVGKIEVRGDVSALDADDIVRITSSRALVLCPYDECAELRARLAQRFELVLDVTGALAGLEVRGDALMRRLTELDLDALPAVGAVARVPTFVLRRGDEFRLFFPQEYAHYLAGVVLDAIEGLA